MYHSEWGFLAPLSIVERKFHISILHDFSNILVIFWILFTFFKRLSFFKVPETKLWHFDWCWGVSLRVGYFDTLRHSKSWCHFSVFHYILWYSVFFSNFLDFFYRLFKFFEFRVHFSYFWLMALCFILGWALGVILKHVTMYCSALPNALLFVLPYFYESFVLFLMRCQFQLVTIIPIVNIPIYYTLRVIVKWE